MIIDLFLAVVALGGSALLGYLLGKREATGTYETALYECQSALETARTGQAEASAQLQRCMKRRRDTDRKLVDLQAKMKSQDMVEAPPARPIDKVQPKLEKAAEQREVLSRIKSKSKSINFERIGRASRLEKDDLKQIKGVGPFIEKKLNALGIYTYAQVSKFNQEDETKVNEAIEFFPGRIKRDQWVMQATDLEKAKSSS